MTRKEIKFTEIVQMIADGTVPEGTKFYTAALCGAGTPDMISASMSGDGDTAFLYWDQTFGTPSENKVQLSKYVLSDQWYIEVPEVELSALEAMAELQKGNSVKGFYAGEEYTLSPYEDFDGIWDNSPWEDFTDLLNRTVFYKVVA